MLQRVLRFYRGTTEWRMVSRAFGTLCILSATALMTEKDKTGALWMGGIALAALALGVLAGDRTNKIVLISLLVIGVITGGYLALPY